MAVKVEMELKDILEKIDSKIDKLAENVDRKIDKLDAKVDGVKEEVSLLRGEVKALKTLRRVSLPQRNLRKINYL